MSGKYKKDLALYAKIERKLDAYPPVLREYYTSQRANRKSATTINVYVNNIIHFMNFIGKNGIANDFYKSVGIGTIESYMIATETRDTGEKIGDDCAQQRWSTLNGFFDFLLKRKYVDSNPVIAVNRPQNHTEHSVTYLNRVEIGRLLKAIDRNKDRVMRERDKAIVSLALATALRVSALVNINIEDLDFENGLIKVIEKRQKVREIPIGDNTANMLHQWLSVRNEAFSDHAGSELFLSQKHNRISVDAVSDMLVKYCDDAKIKRITPHKLRATAACALAKAGIPIKSIAKQLGHNNTQVTQRYIAAFEEDDKKVKSTLDNLF